MRLTATKSSSLANFPTDSFIAQAHDENVAKVYTDPFQFKAKTLFKKLTQI
jgi:hypothetical protein